MKKEMRVFSQRSLTFLLALLLTLTAAGCGATQLPTMPPLPSAAEAQSAVCNSLTGINNSVATLAAVDGSMAVADIKALKANIDTAVQAVKAANSVLNRPNITELTNAYDNLALQINNLPDGANLNESAMTNIRAGTVAVQTALGQARTALSCP
jgi:hypothetical protein